VLMYAKRERKWEESFSLAWLAAMFVLSELFLLKLGSRFAMPSLPVTAIFAAYGFERLSSSKSRLIALLAFLLLAAELAPSLAIGAIGFKSARVSYETNTFQINSYFPNPPTKDEFMRFAYGPVLDGINYLNWETPPGSKALVNVPLTYFINRTIYHTSAIDKMGSLG